MQTSKHVTADQQYWREAMLLQVMDEELERKNKKLEDDPYDYNLKDALFTEESKVWAALRRTMRMSMSGRLKLFHVSSHFPATNDR